MTNSGSRMNFARMYSVASHNRRGVDRIIFFGEKYHFLCGYFGLETVVAMTWHNQFKCELLTNENENWKETWLCNRTYSGITSKSCRFLDVRVRASKTVTECRRLCARMTNKTTKQECQTFNILFRLLFFYYYSNANTGEQCHQQRHTHIQWLRERRDQQKARIALIPLKCHAHTDIHTRAHIKSRDSCMNKMLLHMYENMRAR